MNVNPTNLLATVIVLIAVGAFGFVVYHNVAGEEQTIVNDELLRP